MIKAKPKIIVILGPTGAGKSELAVQMARKYNGEVVSADSRQIYRGMDIATGKVLGEPRDIDGEHAVMYKEIPHYLIDIIDPDQEYTLARFQEDAFRVMDKIIARRKIPFLVGGTGLYIQAVVDNLDIPGGEPDSVLRADIEQKIKDLGLEAVYEELQGNCPNLAKSVDSRNPRRVLRAMEICARHGDMDRGAKDPRYAALQIGMDLDRQEMYDKILRRVDKMVQHGLVEETQKLLAKYDKDLPSVSGIGYLQLSKHLDGEMPLEQAVELMKRDTRRYAKRQMTWFGRDDRIHWIESPEQADELIFGFVK